MTTEEKQDYESVGSASTDTLKIAVEKAELLLADQESARKTITYKAVLLMTLSLALAGFLYHDMLALLDVETPVRLCVKTALQWGAISFSIAAIFAWVVCTLWAYRVLSVEAFHGAGMPPYFSIIKREWEDSAEYANLFLWYTLKEYDNRIRTNDDKLADKSKQLKFSAEICVWSGILTALFIVLNIAARILGGV